MTEYSGIGLKMKIKLNKEIYSAEHIQQAVLDYSSLADIRLTEENGYFVCLFSACRYDEQRTAKEFVNYVTDLMNHTNS